RQGARRKGKGRVQVWRARLKKTKIGCDPSLGAFPRCFQFQMSKAGFVFGAVRSWQRFPTKNRCPVLFFQAEDGIRYFHVTGVQTCALPISTVCTRWLATVESMVGTPVMSMTTTL